MAWSAFCSIIECGSFPELGSVETHLELEDVLHIVELVLVSALRGLPSAIDPCRNSDLTQLALIDRRWMSPSGHDELFVELSVSLLRQRAGRVSPGAELLERLFVVFGSHARRGTKGRTSDS